MRPEVPASYYEALGRITAAAAVLDLNLLDAAHCLDGRSDGSDPESLWKDAKQGVLAELRQAIKHARAPELQPAARTLLDNAQAALGERNEAVHSAIVLDPSTPEQWLTHHPQSGREVPIDADRVLELNELARRMHGLSLQASRLAAGAARLAAADSSRTTERSQ